MTVFEVLFIEVPTEKQEEDGKKVRIVGDVQRVIAKNEQTAVLVAGRAIPDLLGIDPDQIEAKVRTF